MKFFFILTFFLLSKSFAQLVPPEKMARVKAMANAMDRRKIFDIIEIKPRDNMPGFAWSMKLLTGNYRIEYNPIMFSQLGNSAKNLIFFHEIGHVVLGHCDRPRPISEAAIRNDELQADAFAAFLYKRFETVDSELKKFFDFVRTSQGQTNPPGHERVKLFESILYN